LQDTRCQDAMDDTTGVECWNCNDEKYTWSKYGTIISWKTMKSTLERMC